MTWHLPDGLPPGRFRAQEPPFPEGEPGMNHALWITDDPVPDAGVLRARLLRQHEDTGWWPLLLLTMRPYGAGLEFLKARGTISELMIEKRAR